MDHPLAHEEALYAQGYTAVGGMDEAGRGPLAGPVVACALVFPRGVTLEGVDDSKKLSEKKRNALYETILENVLSYGIGAVDAETIDRINILQATLLAMKQAVTMLTVKPQALIIDGNRAPVLEGYNIYTVCLPKADSLCHSVAAASIIAKVTRDRYMEELHRLYPLYGFNKHKGYGTAEHRAAIRQYGPCPQHRRSFKIAEY
jgi:ribonuclease HII